MVYDPFEITITEQMRKDANDRHLFYGESFKNHEIEGGKGRIWGSLGEIIVGSKLEDCTEALTFNYDLIWRGETWDIKTKTRKDIPRADWDASIAASAMHQKTDNYIFVSILSQQNLIAEDEKTIMDYPYETAYVLGWISKDVFVMNSRLQKAGSTDPRNGIIYRMDTYTLPYRDLNPFGKLINESAPTINPRAKVSDRADSGNRPKVFQRFR